MVTSLATDELAGDEAPLFAVPSIYGRSRHIKKAAERRRTGALPPSLAPLGSTAWPDGTPALEAKLDKRQREALHSLSESIGAKSVQREERSTRRASGVKTRLAFFLDRGFGRFWAAGGFEDGFLVEDQNVGWACVHQSRYHHT